jgi:hypothetical protein
VKQNKKNTIEESAPAAPVSSTAWESLKKKATGWGGVIATLGALITAIIYIVVFNNKVDGLKSDIEAVKSSVKDSQTNIHDVSKDLNSRIDQLNLRIDNLVDSRARATSPLGKLIPTPESAKALSPRDLKTRFQQASYLVNAELKKQVPEKPVVVQQIRSDLESTLKTVSLPPDVHEAGIVALAHVEGYAVFSSRVFMQGIQGVVFLPEGKTLLAGGGNDKPDLRIGAIWNVGKGQELTAFLIGPTFPPPSVFYADAPSVMTDLSILAFGSLKDLDAITLRGENGSALVYHVTIQGLHQNLGKIAWLSVTFQNCVVKYDGGPLYLADVRFINCKYEFGSDATSQKVLSEITSRGEQPVNLVTGLQ